MKRIISLIIAVVIMTSAALIPANAEVWYSDTFEDFNDQFWLLAGTAFYVESGVLEGFHDAVVQQSYYENEGDGIFTGAGTFDVFSLQFDARAIEPDADGDHWVGIRIHDYQPFLNGDAVDHDVYIFRYLVETCTYELVKNDKIVGSYEDPKKLGFTDADWYKMGLEVEAGKITCYVDGQEVIAYESSTLGQSRTPLMFWNCGTYCQFDNIIVGDNDELPLAPPTPTGDANADGSTNMKDAIAICKHVADWEGVIKDEYNADITADGKVNIKDAAAILKFIAEG